MRWYIGFCFTNAYLAMKYFGKNKKPHNQFKMTASTVLTQFESANLHQTRQLNVSSEQALHLLEKLPYSKDCFYCQHGFEKPQRETQPLSDMLLAKSQSASQPKAHVGTFT